MSILRWRINQRKMPALRSTKKDHTMKRRTFLQSVLGLIVAKPLASALSLLGKTAKPSPGPIKINVSADTTQLTCDIKKAWSKSNPLLMFHREDIISDDMDAFFRVPPIFAKRAAQRRG
jgi:hypothetical protein